MVRSLIGSEPRDGIACRLASHWYDEDPNSDD